ncbi:MAG TPA: PAS domain S-box protein, partial [Thermoanaerobaculia bacterium]|nr:PAS domain S-box protein [Thermoanaerobaculia bacterium]
MTPLRVLLVEDSDDDAMLVEGLLRRDGFDVSLTRVEERAALDAALALDWDLVISDFSLPQFTAVDVIRAVRERGLDLPLLIVSGTIGEETAVETMRIGADDYLMKGKLQRLPMAIRRELREFEIRRERRAAAEKLHENERLMVQALALARMGHFVWYLDSDLVVWSDDTYRIHGVTRETFTPSLASWLTLVHEEDRDRARTEVAESIVSGSFETSVRIVTPQGEVRIIDLLGESEKNEAGDAISLLGVVKDVTESRRAEGERHRLQRDLELLLASTIQAMVATDGEGRCTMVNAAAELLTGFRADEMLGARFVDLLPQKRRDGSREEDLETPIHQALGTATSIQKTDVPFVVRDGSTRWIDISVSPIVDGGELKGAVALITDATDRRLLQAELERARRLTSLGQMAASI